MPRTIKLVIATGDRPLTMNAAYKMHEHKRHKIIKQWHQATNEALTATGKPAPKFQAFQIIARPAYPDGRSKVDTAAIAPTVKAIVDALVRAGVAPDDTPEHYLGETHRPRVIDRDLTRPVVDVVVIEAEPEPGHTDCDCRLRRENAQLKQQLARTRR